MLWWFAQTTLIAGGLAVVATLAGRAEAARAGGAGMRSGWSCCSSS